MLRFLPALAIGVASLVAIPAADADVVSSFTARVKNIKLSYGAYTAVFESRVYDTLGAPPPPLHNAQIRFPRGAVVRREFLTKKVFCDTVRLEQTTIPETCRRSRFGGGTVLLDPRPGLPAPIPADIHLFLASAREPGATAAVAVLVESNALTPVYDSQVLYGALFRDSGQFSYRLVLPTAIVPRLPDMTLNLAELNLTIRGLTMATQKKKLFWTKLPQCSSKTSSVKFEATYHFETMAPAVKQHKVPCSRLLKSSLR